MRKKMVQEIATRLTSQLNNQWEKKEAALKNQLEAEKAA